MEKLISVLEETRNLLAAADNDFTWSSWRGHEDALAEIDLILYNLRSGILPHEGTLRVLFAPTGPIQEVSLSSGWGSEFIELSNRFDEAMASAGTQDLKDQPLESLESCTCFGGKPDSLIVSSELGTDNCFGEVSVLLCRICGQLWLRYFYEVEAFTGSGRWYLGAITYELHSTISLENARHTLEHLGWYFYGGSYYGGSSGRTSGAIGLNP